MMKPLFARRRNPERANVCVVGGGHWGKNLIRNFQAIGHLRGVYDSDSRTLERMSAEYPDALKFEDYDEALGSDEIDAIVLATPAETHYPLAMQALAADKDVFVEKPLALDVEDGHTILETAREHGAVLMVGHLLQYHPAVLKMQELLRTGVLGRIEYIYSNRLSMGKIRKEENALWSFAPHDISVILSLVDQMPLQVTATGGAYLQPNIADVTVSNLLFENGARSHIFVSWLHPYKEQRLVVVGTRQMAVFEDTRQDDKLLLYDKCIERKNGGLEATKPTGRAVPLDLSEPLRSECLHFIDCVQNRRTPRTSGEEGLRVLQVLQACQRSLQMNGEPVQVAPRSLRKMVAI
jgi:UDP-2-acetamido-3-amino-2,3-dideoxy-glucuronate N-acetyltransferase